jgi:hypothetical protein
MLKIEKVTERTISQKFKNLNFKLFPYKGINKFEEFFGVKVKLSERVKAWFKSFYKVKIETFGEASIKQRNDLIISINRLSKCKEITTFYYFRVPFWIVSRKLTTKEIISIILK